MNEKLVEFENRIKTKRVTVIGIGISNLPLIKYLRKLGAEVTACDKRTADKLGENYFELEKIGVTMHLGDNYLSDIDGDIIFKTPGMRYDIPELNEARARGVEVTSEMEVFFDICPCTIIGVTGSDGKTTTTTLINKMLEKAGYKTWLGGNIGKPLLTEVGQMNPEDYAVLELSSFQLHTMKKSPHIAVITNISPNHLDMHKSYREYIDAKKNIMLYQNENDILVTNYSNEVTRKIGEEAKAETRYFSSKEDAFIHLSDGAIYCGDEKILNIVDIKIPGMHNVENYMTAIGAVLGMVKKEDIVSVAKEFGGVEHRIELVRELDGVKYYNSSIDSSPNRTKNTLSVFKNKVVMISGGKDKGIPYDELGPVILDNVRVLILIGATAKVIEAALNKACADRGAECPVKVLKAKNYPEAVAMARENAVSGESVVLSPASTSFDMFRNFEERGNLFKKLVNEL